MRNPVAASSACGVPVAARHLDGAGERARGALGPIGQYLGHPVPGSVTFKGMEYRFGYVIDSRSGERIGPRKLYLEPGLVYVAG
jgi:hypothetical protein